MKARQAVSIKELHAKTGEVVRQASQSDRPIQITDRGKPIAILGNLRTGATGRPRRRALLPEYRDLLRKAGKGSVLDDLSAVRGDR